MKNYLWPCFLILFTTTFAYAQKEGVSFVSPKNGATVSSPFKVVFAVHGMKVAPAGTATPKTGHHHLIIDEEPIAQGRPIPTTPKHIHYGQGQTEAEVTLPPGEHKLTMQFADGSHLSYGPKWSKTIKVIVK